MTRGVEPGSRAARAYGVLLRAYPARFRERFESGMRETFARDHAQASRGGARTLAVFWAVTVAEACWYGLAERRTPVRPGPFGLPLSIERPSMRSSLSFDWRDAYRSLRATPVVTAVAVLSLALGIGANTALFSILDSLLLKPLPVREPQRLVLLDAGSWTNPIWEQIRGRQQLFESAFAWSSNRFDVSERGESEFVAGAMASAAMFDVLGVRAEIGRTFTPADDARGGGPDGPVAVISHRLWQQRFGGAADVLGRRFTVQRAPFTIVGVMPAGFFGLDVGASLDVVIPIGTEPVIHPNSKSLDERSHWWLEIMARLKPGQTAEEATLALRGVQRQIHDATLPAWEPRDLEGYLKDPFTMVSAATGVSGLRTRYQTPLTAILVVVAVVLLIACGNIANLLIARATARRPELSLRLALGASRWRLSRQLLLEGLILAGTGAAVGLVFAQWGGRLLVRQLTTATNVVWLDLSLDWRVMLFTAGVAVVTAVFFSVAPVLTLLRVAPNEALKERGRGVTGDARFGLRNALVVAQVALSLTLVVAAGLFARTFSSLAGRPLGFDAGPVLVVGIDAGKSAVPAADRRTLFARMEEAVAGLPGVASVAASALTPVGPGAWNMGIELADGPALARNQKLSWINAVSPGWFATYGMRVTTGRGIDDRDRLGAPMAAVVNEAFVRRFLPGKNPIGVQIPDRPEKTTYEIVGVSEDAVYRSLRAEAAPTMFIAFAQQADQWSSLALSVRASGGDPMRLSRSIADALDRVEPRVALTFRPLTDQVRASLTQEQLVARLSGFFGLLALLLAGLGLYGVTSYSVSRRRAEIGIRMALGANAPAVARLVLRQIAWLVGLGVLIGAGASLWAARFISSLLYGLAPRDLTTLVMAAAVMAGVGALAGWLPARRAARIDPTVVLRDG